MSVRTVEDVLQDPRFDSETDADVHALWDELAASTPWDAGRVWLEACARWDAAHADSEE